MIKILNMCALKATSKSSPRSCLLLNFTLLFLLCIYIKRVTSLDDGGVIDNIKKFGATINAPLYADLSVGIVGDQAYDIQCPYEDAVKIKDGVNRKLAKFWRERVLEQAKIIWRKDNEPLHRKDGDPYIENQLQTNKGIISLISLTLADAGEYTCWLDYRNVSNVARMYLELRPYITFSVRVLEKPYLPDMKPSISHPPTNLLVHRGENATFTCKSPPTLSHQTTTWFSCACHKNETLCNQFMTAYNRTIDDGNQLYQLQKYFLRGQDGDELKLDSVSETNIGYYGCVVENTHGHDIRLAQLNLVEVFLENYVNSTTTASLTITTTDSTSSAVINAVNINHGRSNSIQNASAAATTNTTSIDLVHYLNLNAGASTEQSKFQPIYLAAGLIIIFTVCSLILFKVTRIGIFIRKDKNTVGTLIQPEPIVGVTSAANMHQHLLNGDCADIYNISNGVIRNSLMQNDGHLSSQFMSGRAYDKENNPSISSNSNSDKAPSCGKSVSYQSDDSRNLYLHTSNTTTTTVPLYDHPPLTGTSHICGPLVQNACVINPTYGLQRPESAATERTLPRRNPERLNNIGEGVKQLKEPLEQIEEIENHYTELDHPDYGPDDDTYYNLVSTEREGVNTEPKSAGIH